eukprot:gene10409-13983_t
METDSSFYGSVEAFVTESGGDHAIQKILIANNGIGATKAIISIRRWAFETFGNDRMIKFVVMATPEDMKANAEYIRMADQVVDVPGGSNNNNYANINLICQIAETYKVDAVMPMWGHASENPSLPTSILKLNHRVTFIGPAAEPMQALGDKIGSTIIAQSAGVPTIAWNGDGLTVDYKATGIPQSVYDAANVTTPEDALACADRIGYPVMIKASEGGGGKGIRKVHRSEDVYNSFRQVQSEIPGSPIFVMKMASKARHLEVQLLADKYGDAIALSGRDCSVQRRHQKIIEEGPPIAAPTAVFKKMEQAAVALAKTVGYCNAGTVEYLFLEEDYSFAFLELNPRLQVEHPVTENILGINLPACQVQVAMGIPLHRIVDIRKMYGRNPKGKDTIDYDFTERAPNPRHCIAVRVTAENPESSFQPTSGLIRELHFHSSIDVWGYFSVNNSGLIHEFADSQFGHVFAGGKDRESARRAMVVALKKLLIRGDIRTTVEYIIKMIQSSDFVNNKIDTDWLDGRISRHKALSIEENLKFSPSPTLVALCGTALQGYQYFRERDLEFVNMIKIGQIPSKDTLSPAVNIDLIFENIKYKTVCLQSGPETVIIVCNNVSQSIGIRTLADGGCLLNVDGFSHTAYSKVESGGSIRMILDGHTCMFTPEYDPTKLTSSVAGKLARLLVPDGSHVNAGDPFVEIEVMKMYMPLKALEAGTVTFKMSEGATLSPGDIIATVNLDNPDSVIRATEFTGILKSGENEDDIIEEVKTKLPHILLKEAKSNLEKILDGFPLSDDEVKSSLYSFVESSKDPLLPFHKVEESMSVLRGRIDQDLSNSIRDLNNQYFASLSSGNEIKFPASKMLSLIQSFATSLAADKRQPYLNLTADLWATIEPFVFPAEAVILSTLVGYLDKYLAVEKIFDNFSFTDVVNQLRKEYASDLDKVLQICRAHVNVASKSALILLILEEIKSMPVSQNKQPELPVGITIRNELQTRKLKIKLTHLAKLERPIYARISFAANLLLIDQFSLSIENRRDRLNECIVSCLSTGESIGGGDRINQMKKFIDSNIVIRDLFIDSLRHDPDYQIAVMELYVRKIYQKTHNVDNLTVGTHLSSDESNVTTPWLLFDFTTKAVEAIAQTDNTIGKNISYSDLASLSRKGISLSSLPIPDHSLASKSTEDDRLSNISHNDIRNPVAGNRSGIFAVIHNIKELQKYFPLIINKIQDNPNIKNYVNAVHIIITDATGLDGNDNHNSSLLSSYLSSQLTLLRSKYVRRVTFFVSNAIDLTKATAPMPTIFTFRNRTNFEEDILFRHIEAPHAFHLDLPRLSNFTISLQTGIQTSSGNVHIYKAVPQSGHNDQRRYFARLVIFTGDIHSNDLESLFVEALDHLALIIGQEENNKHEKIRAAANHIFINVVSPDTVIQPDYYDTLIRNMSKKYWIKMVRLAVTTFELKLTCRLSADTEPLFIRLVASNPTGFVLTIDKYYEAFVDGKTVFQSLSGKGPLDGCDTQMPYDISQKFEAQRAEAMSSSDTLYVYDWPILFQEAVYRQWCDYFTEKNVDSKDIPPESFFQCKELVLCDINTKQPLKKGWKAKEVENSSVMIPIERELGLNNAGMVAWLITIKTPECVNGRDIVVICNDITFQAGSFGTKEDVIFFKASEYARVRGIPRFFLAANSGARIGMAQSLKSKFNVSWTDENDPSKGFKYIYLSQADYEGLLAAVQGDSSKLPVICSLMKTSEGESRYVISDIIGEEEDLGVENLMGSGLIAGETSRAYDDIFTLTLVVGRTVGIGAYLVRLGQRTIQKTRNAPIILTGYQALNKLMGREIYTTNDQLGGPMIMFPNGVSHMLADTHLDAVTKAMNWLSFIPPVKNAPLPVRNIDGIDTISRLVEVAPLKGIPYDPRNLFCGLTYGKDNSNWQSGFFDRNSFIEALSGWAKTVIVGRGRLGGIPIGVIVTENRTAEATKPADPADSTSQEKLVQQAGGVWFPDSAYKTAQALRDFNREGLPCIIFANWRGFSGGQRDMFDEVLKFGSMIVDALVAYKQPLFVYIPPFAELRGGAWVVVDSTINSDVMEFYAAEDARGGVLEAAGAASIKFRDRDIVGTAHRIDHALIALDKQLANLKQNAVANSDQIAQLSKEIKTREKLLFGVFQQVAVHFADLHDTPGRMKSKGVIRKQVQWEQSRIFFYWRLRRRLLEFDIIENIHKSRTTLASQTSTTTTGYRKTISQEISTWFQQTHPSIDWDNDEQLTSFYQLETNRSPLIQAMIAASSKDIAIELTTRINQLIEGNNSDALQVLKQTLSELPTAQKNILLEALGKN